MSTEIAVQGCSFTYETTPSGSVELAATAAPASSKVKAGGATAYKKQIVITVASGSVNLDSLPANVQNPGVVPPGSITISGSSQKTDSEGDAFVLKGDDGSASFECTFTMTVSPYSTVIPVTIKATVNDPGQNVVKVT